MARPGTRQRGQSVVEAALVAPVLVFLLMIVGDFGRVFYSYMAVVSSARVGAELAANHRTDDSAVISGAQQEANGVIPVSVTVTCFSSFTGSSGCTRAAGNVARVTVIGSYTPMTPLIRAALGPFLAADGTLALRRNAWSPVY